MALTDNLVIKVKAESGQSVITDSLSSATFSGAGTAALVNDGTYGYLWRITGGALSAALSGMGNWTETGAKTTTLAARFRVTNRASNYTRFIQIGTDANNGIFFGNAGSASGSMREGVCIAGSSVSTPAVLTYTTGDVVTLVMTFTETNSASDPISAWKGTTGRSGAAADATSSVAVSTATRAIAAAVLTVATETLDLLNLAYWTRGLSNAEAASVADNIGQLWVTATDGAGTGAPAASSATSPSATASGTTVSNGSASGAPSSPAMVAPSASASGTTVINGYASGVFVASSAVSPSASASGTSDGNGSGVGAPAAANFAPPSASAVGTYVANGTGVGAPVAISASTPSASATGTTASAGTFSTPVLKNNTGTVLANEVGVVVNVYNQITGALVLHKSGQTSNASGIVTITDAALTPGTTYAYEIVLSSARRLPVAIAV